MKNLWYMDCIKAADILFGVSHGDENSLYWKLRVKIHLLFCSRCVKMKKQLVICKDILNTDFFPVFPSLENKIMEKLSKEEYEAEISPEPLHESAGGFSFRAWIIIGFLIFISSISFLWSDFFAFASSLGSSFLIPFGITIGIMLTGYGAFFIGSHLEELRTHFKLH